MRRRGFLLILVVLLLVLLLTMGFGFLGSRVGQYQSTAQAGLAAQARSLARSGIDDARNKLNRDLAFPLQAAQRQSVFTYSENFLDPGGAYVGSYQVSLDSTYSGAPFFVLSITSTGWVGPRGNVAASHTYRAYVDVNSGPPLSPAISPTYFQILRWDDLGSP